MEYPTARAPSILMEGLESGSGGSQSEGGRLLRKAGKASWATGGLQGKKKKRKRNKDELELYFGETLPRERGRRCRCRCCVKKKELTARETKSVPLGKIQQRMRQSRDSHQSLQGPQGTKRPIF